MTAEGKVTPEQSATIAIENAARLETCADQMDTLTKIIIDYLETVK